MIVISIMISYGYDYDFSGRRDVWGIFSINGFQGLKGFESFGLEG